MTAPAANDVMRAPLAAINCPKGTVEANLDTHLRLLEGAAPGDLALFPELSLTGTLDPSIAANYLARLDHPAVLKLVAATGSAGVCACFGIAERGPGGLPFITQVVAADGKLLGVQRKRYLGEGEGALTGGSGDAVL